jgi:hypothetical protein
MGTSSLLDVVGSFVFGGILLLMGLQLNAGANEARAVYSINYNLQSNLTTLVGMIEIDFRKIGYCRDWRKLPDPSLSILTADSNRIKFLCDFDNNSAVDTVTYRIGPPSELANTPNPFDCYLYRKVNSYAEQRFNLGLTQFRFTYKNVLDDTLFFPIADPRNVYYMILTIGVSSAQPYKMEYMNDPSRYQVLWKQMRLVTKNLKNR